VISKYLENPLLIGGRKFDLRLYVLVTSYRPLKVYLYGALLIFKAKVQRRVRSILFGAVQPGPVEHGQPVHAPDQRGGAEEQRQLQRVARGQVDAAGAEVLHRERVRAGGDPKGKRGKKCMDDINELIVISLRSVQNQMVQHKHCFELYGYDVILDDKCRPWLIEINASPSLSTNSVADKKLKKNLIGDVISIVLPSDLTEYS